MQLPKLIPVLCLPWLWGTLSLGTTEKCSTEILESLKKAWEIQREAVTLPELSCRTGIPQSRLRAYLLGTKALILPRHAQSLCEVLEIEYAPLADALRLNGGPETQAEKLDRLLFVRGWTATKLANQLGVGPGVIGRMLDGAGTSKKTQKLFDAAFQILGESTDRATHPDVQQAILRGSHTLSQWFEESGQTLREMADHLAWDPSDLRDLLDGNRLIRLEEIRKISGAFKRFPDALLKAYGYPEDSFLPEGYLRAVLLEAEWFHSSGK